MKKGKKFKKPRKKKSKILNKNFLLGVFIVLLMVSSGFGIMFSGFNTSSSEDSEFKYEEYKFKKITSDGMIKYQTEVGEKEMSFFFLPKEVENINISNDVKNLIKGKSMALLTSESDSMLKEEIALAKYQMQKNLEDTLNIYSNTGFIDDNYEKIQKITCENATQSTPVIYYKFANSTSITKQGNCILFKGDDRDKFLRMNSRLLYSIHGIME